MYLKISRLELKYFAMAGIDPFWIVKLIICISILGELSVGKSFNKTAYQIMSSGQADRRFIEHMNKLKSKPNSNPYAAISAKYLQFQLKHYTDSVNAAAKAKSENGYRDVEASCAHCEDIESDQIPCYTDCITETLGIFKEYGRSIAETINNFFCQPIGFKFLEEYYSPPKSLIFTRFYEFKNSFDKNKKNFPMRTLVEIWLSNFLLLEHTPLYFHSFLRGSMASAIINGEGDGKINVEKEKLTPSLFASQCSSSFAADIAPDIYNLIVSSKERPHLMDVILRGLFTLRSEAFYTDGSQHRPLAAGILEVMGAIVGRKCGILGYAEGMSNVGDCDQLGMMPVTHFPYPDTVANLVPPCN